MTDTPTSAATPAKSSKISVKNFFDHSKVQEDLAYSVVDIGAGMGEQASLFVHYGAMAARASAQVDKFKLYLETAEAKVDRQVREEAVKSGDKLTEARIEKLVITHDSIIALKNALLEAKQIEAGAKTVVEAFKHRRDMLIQQGLLLREEMKGEVYVKARDEAAAAQIERMQHRVAERQARENA